MRLLQSRNSLFYIDATIDGVTLPFMIDTGASDIMLNPGEARSIRIDLSRLHYDRLYKRLSTWLPKRETILSPWLTEGSINMVFADRGIGKTFFCLSCAVALANGEAFQLQGG